MKVKVLKEFINKDTKILHEKDTELIISEERFEEINSTAHGILVKEIKEEKANKTSKKQVIKWHYQMVYQKMLDYIQT